VSSKKSTEEQHVLVNVRAVERPGFNGFFRGGVKWPSSLEGRVVFVTPGLLKRLRAEPRLAVSQLTELPDGVSAEDLERLEEPARLFIDPDQEALDRMAAAQADAKRLDAHEQALALEKANADRRAKLGLADPTEEQRAAAAQYAATAKAAADAAKARQAKAAAEQQPPPKE
jgi:hypothetical protein